MVFVTPCQLKDELLLALQNVIWRDELMSATLRPPQIVVVDGVADLVDRNNGMLVPMHELENKLVQIAKRNITLVSREAEVPFEETPHTEDARISKWARHVLTLTYIVS